jgi:hypothetical protein
MGTDLPDLYRSDTLLVINLPGKAYDLISRSIPEGTPVFHQRVGKGTRHNVAITPANYHRIGSALIRALARANASDGRAEMQEAILNLFTIAVARAFPSEES